MRFKQWLAAAIAAAAGTATLAGLWPATAQAATTAVPLPIAQYSHMLVDVIHRHLFITSEIGRAHV